MKGGHDQMKSKCGFYSKFGYCEGVVEEFGKESWRVRVFPPSRWNSGWSCVSAVFLQTMWCPHIALLNNIGLVLHNQTWHTRQVIVIPMKLSTFSIHSTFRSCLHFFLCNPYNYAPPQLTIYLYTVLPHCVIHVTIDWRVQDGSWLHAGRQVVVYIRTWYSMLHSLATFINQ